MCEWRIIDFDTSRNHVAYETQRTIANQRTWQQAGFAQNLKAVTRPENELAGMRITNARFQPSTYGHGMGASGISAVMGDASTRQVNPGVIPDTWMRAVHPYDGLPNGSDWDQ